MIFSEGSFPVLLTKSLSQRNLLLLVDLDYPSLKNNTADKQTKDTSPAYIYIFAVLNNDIIFMRI